MLRTNQRESFGEILRAPEGYQLDFLLGTTFSLDMTMLLTLPLIYSFRSSEEASGRPLQDSVARLTAVRQHAGKMAVFVQAGRIHSPQFSPLMTFIERTIIPVDLGYNASGSRSEGVFHPKVWVARFVGREGQKNAEIRYKVAIQSRNLTDDRSWDVVVALDGILQTKRRGIDPKPLSDFVRALPAYALSPVAKDRQGKIEVMAEELVNVRFKKPEGFQHLNFWPMGPGFLAPTIVSSTRAGRTLIVSPFLTGSELSHWASENSHDNILVSRFESLRSMAAQKLVPFGDDVYAFDDGRTTDVGLDDGTSRVFDGQKESASDRDMSGTLQGLHAKLFIREEGTDAHWYVGSANATHHAFHTNMEFVVELVGRCDEVGIETLMGQDEDLWSFRRQLRQFVPSDDAEDMVDDDSVQWEAVTRRIAASPWSLQVSAAAEPDHFHLTISIPNSLSKLQQDYPGLTASVRPMSLRDVPFGDLVAGGRPIVFSDVSLTHLTAFFLVKVVWNGVSRTVLVKAESPDLLRIHEREVRLQVALLPNAESLMRYVAWSALDPEDPRAIGSHTVLHGGGTGNAGPSSGTGPTLESWMRTLYYRKNQLPDAERVLQLWQKAHASDVPSGYKELLQVLAAAKQWGAS